VIVLSLDTCLSACAGAVVRNGETLARIVEPMQRGHQERIAGMTAELMAQAGLTFAELDRVAVTVGPGSFTGLRIGLAFAKGLGVALDLPCAGVGVLEVLGRQAGEGRVLAVLDARGGQVQRQAFQDGVPLDAPQTVDIAQAAAEPAPAILIGEGAPLLAAAFPLAQVVVPEACDPVLTALLGARDPIAPPEPIYMRAAYA
jgi:tRNA threonylcarbamoyladenosine biosynthesis protein TsaB